MNLYARDWDIIQQTYHPGKISDYVERGLEKMYYGTAPTLGEINTTYGSDKYEALVAVLIDEIFKFAGLKDKFTSEVMVTVAHTIRTEYPWLKITELMHFVYLFRLGSFDKFYGKPNGATLMQMLRQYVKTDREKLRAEFTLRREKEERLVELNRQRLASSAQMSALVAAEIANAFGEEARARARWRYQPWGTAMARAYFVDRTLAKFPGDMDESEQYAWARENEAYVKLHPNLNKSA